MYVYSHRVYLTFSGAPDGSILDGENLAAIFARNSELLSLEVAEVSPCKSAEMTT